MYLFYMFCVYKEMIINGIFYCFFYKFIIRIFDFWVINLIILGRGMIEYYIYFYSLFVEDYVFF